MCSQRICSRSWPSAAIGPSSATWKRSRCEPQPRPHSALTSKRWLRRRKSTRKTSCVVRWRSRSHNNSSSPERRRRLIRRSKKKTRRSAGGGDVLPTTSSETRTGSTGSDNRDERARRGGAERQRRERRGRPRTRGGGGTRRSSGGCGCRRRRHASGRRRSVGVVRRLCTRREKATQAVAGKRSRFWKQRRQRLWPGTRGGVDDDARGRAPAPL